MQPSQHSSIPSDHHCTIALYHPTIPLHHPTTPLHHPTTLLHYPTTPLHHFTTLHHPATPMHHCTTPLHQSRSTSEADGHNWGILASVLYSDGPSAFCRLKRTQWKEQQCAALVQMGWRRRSMRRRIIRRTRAKEEAAARVVQYYYKNKLRVGVGGHNILKARGVTNFTPPNTAPLHSIPQHPTPTHHPAHTTLAQSRSVFSLPICAYFDLRLQIARQMGLEQKEQEARDRQARRVSERSREERAQVEPKPSP